MPASTCEETWETYELCSLRGVRVLVDDEVCMFEFCFVAPTHDIRCVLTCSLVPQVLICQLVCELQEDPLFNLGGVGREHGDEPQTEAFPSAKIFEPRLTSLPRRERYDQLL